VARCFSADGVKEVRSAFLRASLFITRSLKHTPAMAKTGKTVATLLIGAAIGAAIGYVLATDKDTRTEGMDRLRDRWSSLRDRFSNRTQDLEEEIYNA